MTHYVRFDGFALEKSAASRLTDTLQHSDSK